MTIHVFLPFIAAGLIIRQPGEPLPFELNASTIDLMCREIYLRNNFLDNEVCIPSHPAVNGLYDILAAEPFNEFIAASVGLAIIRYDFVMESRFTRFHELKRKMINFHNARIKVFVESYYPHAFASEDTMLKNGKRIEKGRVLTFYTELNELARC